VIECSEQLSPNKPWGIKWPSAAETFALLRVWIGPLRIGNRHLDIDVHWFLCGIFGLQRISPSLLVVRLRYSLDTNALSEPIRPVSDAAFIKKFHAQRTPTIPLDPVRNLIDHSFASRSFVSPNITQDKHFERSFDSQRISLAYKMKTRLPFASRRVHTRALHEQEV
jgi:hypothetical protein